MIVTFEFKLSPNKTVAAKLDQTLHLCRELYNAAIFERSDAYKYGKNSISYNAQSAQLPIIKESNPEYAAIHSTISQSVLKRAEHAFDNFFRRVTSGSGEAPGYPRYKGANRFRSFKLVQSGFRLEGDKLHLSKIGSCRIKLTRDVIGKIKTCQIVKRFGKWFAIFTVETTFMPLPKLDTKVGFDAGVSKLGVFSDNTEIENPHFTDKAATKLAKAQQRLSRRKKFSKRWKKASRLVAKIHAAIAARRKDNLHHLANDIIRRYGYIAIEDLNIKDLVQLGLGKEISDVSWARLFNYLHYKAEKAGRVIVKVTAAGTSQYCICEHYVPKTLNDRVHDCSRCGIKCDRDLMSSLVIEQRAFRTPLADLTSRAGIALQPFNYSRNWRS